MKLIYKKLPLTSKDRLSKPYRWVFWK